MLLPVLLSLVCSRVSFLSAKSILFRSVSTRYINFALLLLLLHETGNYRYCEVKLQLLCYGRDDSALRQHSLMAVCYMCHTMASIPDVDVQQTILEHPRYRCCASYKYCSPSMLFSALMQMARIFQKYIH